ncbi:SprT-like domain-containing protein [Carnimonas nigrificans]|uniref:SprT family zinc-dependent metalloprotease n=1 Tax=Carnimonas nigrificans TaxID=64323 RepID=UPI001FDF8809|nr:SprT-like domain-containing protein [Carnimonas nigrificans]
MLRSHEASPGHSVRREHLALPDHLSLKGILSSMIPTLDPGDALAPLFSPADDDVLAELSAAELMAEVERQVGRCMAHAQRWFPRLPDPKVWGDLRGKSAGQAHFGRGGVRFNKVLLSEQPRIFINEVVPHEIAHWVVYHGISARVAPHGKEWRRVMVVMFGLPPAVTHRFDTSVASPAPYLYGCGCRDEYGQLRLHGFSLRRHNGVGKGRRYLCKRCRQSLYFIRKAGIEDEAHT